ncbi:site-specific integrase [Methanolobus sp. ZRKC3]|uniref:tyrosine-type recombinase/integrase n=1 Tax=Methanolobus sp. ZRKC3 TaxID=3125786 RepID=UPI0032517475
MKYVRGRYKSEDTRHDYLVTIKKYYRWLNAGEDPEITKFFRATKNKSKTKLPDDLLTESEVLAMIETTRNPKDRALIAVLWDSGARIGEIGTLLLKNVRFDEYGAEFLVSGKTGMRRVRAVFSVPYLMRWMEVHPDKDNSDAPLWWNDNPDPNNIKTAMGHASLTKQIKKAANAAGIKKKVHAHLFRHSRATYMANHLTEAQMDAIFGWVQGSTMPSTYIHLSGRDTDKAILKAQGIDIGGDDTHGTNVQKCPRCQRINTPQSVFCVNCGAALNINAVNEIESEQNDLAEMKKQIQQMQQDMQKMGELTKMVSKHPGLAKLLDESE